MRQCYFCKSKTGLKSIWLEEDFEIGKEESKRACCKRCFFDNELENDMDIDESNWDDFDYRWDRKKSKTNKSEEITR